MRKFIFLVSVILFLNLLTGCVFVNRIKERIPFFKKSKTQLIQEETTPSLPLQQTQIKESLEEKIKRYEEEIKANPDNLQARFNLASSYSERGDIAIALFEFQEIIRRAPESEEAKKAREWIKKQTEEAKLTWQNTVGKKVQEAVQIAQYTSITPALKAIAEKIERERMPVFLTTTIATPSSLTPPVGGTQPLTPSEQPQGGYILITIPPQTLSK